MNHQGSYTYDGSVTVEQYDPSQCSHYSNLCYDARTRTRTTSTLSRWQIEVPCRCRPSQAMMRACTADVELSNWNGADAGPPEAFLQQLYRKITTLNATTHRLPTREILHQSLVTAPCQKSNQLGSTENFVQTECLPPDSMSVQALASWRHLLLMQTDATCFDRLALDPQTGCTSEALRSRKGTGSAEPKWTAWCSNYD
ncbi:hypothetical protein M431DRAFT_182890 [Trichoderma harzianum CBS 226.95]|uniref:Uncharacterized protein n=1 Tax=Trichoderma harzianum CBS 226.95 TaxID=983964 RepID=A0A2T4ATU8_TRIHA|nr:hypothetical protein M431DRAFT_182890 [Trichoderma harzianum CBS 226.95]PTB60471.1 hypothetical protein M431DRAFT_182890 [Trichoderma harzianum CBS 226.95]